MLLTCCPSRTCWPARRGDSAAFERLVASYRGELYAHCSRMLGSVQDAEDALQRLPGTQRAVLILREVLGFSAAEVARILDTTPASVNSALQRARKTVDRRVPATSQQAELDALGADGQRELVDAFVAAWERADVAAILGLLAEDARFTMPPLPAWFRGREDVGRFFTERVFATAWRLVPLRANGQLAFACYSRERDGDRFRLGAVNVLGLRGGQIVEIAGFLDPGLHRHLGLPPDLPESYRRLER